MKRGPKRQEGSIRSIGRIVTVGIDEVTKSRLRKLAGDTPLNAKVRELVELGEAIDRGEVSPPGQVPLPGQESLTSRNTIFSISSRVDKNTSLLESIARFIVSGKVDEAVFNFIGMGPEQGYRDRELTPESITQELNALVGRASLLVEKLKEVEQKQGELEFQES